MATISSLGAGSGLDLNGILQKLMAVEQQPLLALARKEAAVQSKISALGSLKSALSSLQTAAGNLAPASGQTAAQKFTSFKTSVADTTIATATGATGAVAGTYTLDVIQLAKAQRLVTPPTALPAAAKYADSSTAVTQGTLKIELGTLAADGTTFTAASEKNIVIDDSNDTLAGLRDAINAATAGVSATIINSTRTDGSSEARLVITSDTTGLAGVVRLSGIADFVFDPTSGAVGNTVSAAPADGGQTAQNVKIKLNGIEASSASNKVTGVLDGITLNLLKETTTATTLSVTKDNSSLSSQLSAFIKAYNDAAKMTKDLGFYDSTGAKTGPLLGDATLRTVQSQVRDLAFAVPAGLTSTTHQRLSDVGVALQKDGTLTLDSAKLQKAIDADFTAVADVVAGVGSKFKAALEGLAGSTGTVTAASEGLNRTIKDFGSRREALAKRLEAVEVRYRRQFTALDGMVANMNKTGAYLQQQLASLPKIGE